MFDLTIAATRRPVKGRMAKQLNLRLDAARGLISLDRGEEAIACLDECEKSAASIIHDSLSGAIVHANFLAALARSYAAAGLIDKAVIIADRVHGSDSDGSIYAEIAVLASLSGIKKGIPPLFRKAVRKAKELYNPGLTARALTGIAESFIQLGNTFKAGNLLRKAMVIVGQELDESDYKEKITLLSKVVTVYLLMDKITEALECACEIDDASSRTMALLETGKHSLSAGHVRFLKTLLPHVEDSVRQILRAREQALLLVETGILHSALENREKARELIVRAYSLALKNRKKNLILGRMAANLLELSLKV